MSHAGSLRRDGMIIGEIWRRLRVLMNRQRFSAELEEEMQLHKELRAAALSEQLREKGGAGPEPAGLPTDRRQFGNTALLQEASIDAWGVRWLEDFLKDIRFAIRQLRKVPGFTAVAVFSLALGIGANTAIFTLIESTLLRPIAVQHAEQLRLVTWSGRGDGWVAPNLGYVSPTYGWIYEQRAAPDGGLTHTDFSPPFYRQFLHDNTVFESLFGFKELGRVTAVVDGNAEPLNCFVVSGDFYRGMEVSPVIGRAIGPDDVKTQAGSVAVISYDYWTRRFGRSPSALGKTIALNQVPVTIVGVNPQYFTGVVPGGHFEIWAPLSLSGPMGGHSLLDEEKVWSMPLMGRLKPGVSDAQAQSAFDLIFQQKLDADYGQGRFGAMLKDPAKRPHLSVVSGARGVDYLTPHYDRTLLALFALAGVVLLIACTNVANLLLARSAARQREIGLRLALGAKRGRIVRQLLAEGLPLAGMAGVAGLGLGYASRNAIPALLATPWRPNPFATGFDGKVLLVSLGIASLTGFLFSLAPALQSRRVDLNEALKDASRGTASLSKLRAGRLLVVFQIALSVLLLAGAGLCAKTFANLRAIPLGLQPKGVVLFTLDSPRLRYTADRMAALMTALQEQLNAIPGVSSATFNGSGGGTLVQSSSQITRILVNPAESKPGFDNVAYGSDIGNRFFETMGIPILSGRAIDRQDSLKGLRAVVVNQEFGRHFFQQENTVGITFVDSDNVAYRIVGVCADWRVDRLRDAVRPSVYSAFVQAPRVGPVTFAVKISGDEAGVVKAIPQRVRSVDSDLAVTDVRTEMEQIENGLSQERLMASLAAVFGGLTLILASIGIYGAMAYAVTRRTNEIGIRVALGARPSGVAWMVLRETLMLAAAGIAMGVPTVLALSPILNHALAPPYRESFAYGMKPNDPLTIGFAALTLVAVAVLAGYLPARRAARVDPMIALRHD
ncbi:MAG: ABC transporter permease [Acidobacteriota bacterium]